MDKHDITEWQLRLKGKFCLCTCPRIITIDRLSRVSVISSFILAWDEFPARFSADNLWEYTTINIGKIKWLSREQRNLCQILISCDRLPRWEIQTFLCREFENSRTRLCRHWSRQNMRKWVREIQTEETISCRRKNLNSICRNNLNSLFTTFHGCYCSHF